MVALLAPATFFQGYDGLVLGLALPLIGREFGLGIGQRGAIASIVFAGSFGVLLLVPLADRIGRRPVLAWTILGYTLATFLTAFSTGVVDFVAYQFVSRAFLEAEFALATIVLVESLAEERRGRALGFVSSMSAFGQAAAGVGFLIVEAAGASWRWLYAVGVLPLLLVARARRDLPETATWTAGDRSPEGPGGGLGAPRLAGLRSLNRRWLAGSAALAFLFSVFPTAVITLASSLVLDEWRWDLSSINPAYVAVWVVSVSGFFVAGRLMDALGRRPTTAAFFAGATLAGFLAFHQGTTAGRVFGLGAVIFFLTGATPCMAAYSTELFPPEQRARAGAALRVAGLAGAGVAPALTGVLADRVGLAPALSFAGLSYAAGALVVLLVLPETRPAARAAVPEVPPG